MASLFTGFPNPLFMRLDAYMMIGRYFMSNNDNEYSKISIVFIKYYSNASNIPLLKRHILQKIILKTEPFV